MYSKPIFAIFAEVLGSTLVDVGVGLIDNEEGLCANTKPKVNYCQKTAYRLNIH